MAITVQMVEDLASHSLEVLENQLHAANLVHRAPTENEIGVKGKTVNITAPPTFQAKDFNGTLQNQNTEETVISVTLNKHKEVSYILPDFERTVQNRDLIREWAHSAVAPLAQKVDEDVFNAIAYGITDDADIIGANNASLDYAKLALGRKRAFAKKMFSAGGPLNYVVSPDDDATLLDDTKIISRDFNGGGGEAMKDAFIGKARGFNIYTSNNTPAPEPGDTSGAVNNVAGYAAGVSTLAVDGLTVAPAVGAILTFAGHTTRYRVQEGTTDVSLKIAPALTSAVVDNEVITVLDVNMNLGFHRNAAILAMRPMELPMEKAGAIGVIAEHNGIAIRVLVSFTHGNLGHQVSYDILYATELIDPRLAFLHMSQKVA